MTADEYRQLPLLLRREHVLQVTGWSKKTFYKAIEQRRLRPTVTIGRCMYIPKSQVTALLN